jgi:ribosome-associated protein
VIEPILVAPGVVVPDTALQVKAVRASGPGGQNVNKVSSKVELRVDLRAVTGLTESARTRLMSAAVNKLDADGWLLLTSQITRDQQRNLADACEKVRLMIAAAMVEPKKRKPTKPTRGSVKRRLAAKQRTAQTKASRRSRGDD